MKQEFAPLRRSHRRWVKLDMEMKKEQKLVITFPTTTAALSMEAACGASLGRLVSIPGEMRGGCGFAWCAEPGQEAALLAIMAANGIPFEEKRVVFMF